jgi:hypothetical protein
LEDQPGERTVETMNKAKKSVIDVQGTAIAVLIQNEQDYISRVVHVGIQTHRIRWV